MRECVCSGVRTMQRVRWTIDSRYFCSSECFPARPSWVVASHQCTSVKKVTKERNYKFRGGTTDWKRDRKVVRSLVVSDTVRPSSVVVGMLWILRDCSRFLYGGN